MVTNSINKPTSNSQRALRQLRQMIFTEELPAGSDHLETELAEQLDMSRTPVREAILMLEGQGLLELRPRKGARILPLSAKDMAEIYDVLTELESLAAAKAAGAGQSARDLTDLAQAIADVETALGASDLDAWAEAGERFHKELVRLGGNSRVQAIVDMMSDQVRRARTTTLTMRPLPTKSNEDHRKVYQAIKAGDARAACETHRAHRQNAKRLIVEILRKHRPRYV